MESSHRSREASVTQHRTSSEDRVPRTLLGNARKSHRARAAICSTVDTMVKLSGCPRQSHPCLSRRIVKSPMANFSRSDDGGILTLGA